ncbi:MAG TPA: DUF2490 domain-containing protein, partial [Cytophagales bacterium]|nr:DUF2490 domain-containing protein [Cytophagales bacterium]
MLFILVQLAYAQVNDARLWLKGSVEKKLSQRASISGEVSTRIGENISRLQTYYAELSADYKVYKWLGLGLGYR